MEKTGCQHQLSFAFMAGSQSCCGIEKTDGPGHLAAFQFGDGAVEEQLLDVAEVQHGLVDAAQLVADLARVLVQQRPRRHRPQEVLVSHQQLVHRLGVLQCDTKLLPRASHHLATHTKLGKTRDNPVKSIQPNQNR